MITPLDSRVRYRESHHKLPQPTGEFRANILPRYSATSAQPPRQISLVSSIKQDHSFTAHSILLLRQVLL